MAQVSSWVVLDVDGIVDLDLLVFVVLVSVDKARVLVCAQLLQRILMLYLEVVFFFVLKHAGQYIPIDP